MKKKLLIIILLVISITLVGCNKKPKNTKEHKEALIISDISKKCMSNSIHVYYDKKYDVYKAYYSENEEQKPIRTGEYNYDITKIINNIEKYSPDNKNGINYNITINKKKYIVSQSEKNELREFMDSIDGDSLLWCE